MDFDWHDAADGVGEAVHDAAFDELAESGPGVRRTRLMDVWAVGMCVVLGTGLLVACGEALYQSAHGWVLAVAIEVTMRPWFVIGIGFVEAFAASAVATPRRASVSQKEAVLSAVKHVPPEILRIYPVIRVSDRAYGSYDDFLTAKRRGTSGRQEERVATKSRAFWEISFHVWPTPGRVGGDYFMFVDARDDTILYQIGEE